MRPARLRHRSRRHCLWPAFCTRLCSTIRLAAWSSASAPACCARGRDDAEGSENAMTFAGWSVARCCRRRPSAPAASPRPRLFDDELGRQVHQNRLPAFSALSKPMRPPIASVRPFAISCRARCCVLARQAGIDLFEASNSFARAAIGMPMPESDTVKRKRTAAPTLRLRPPAHPRP